MAKTNNRVEFGLKDVHYAVFDDETGEYAAPKPLPGAVSLSLSHEGDTDTFFADDGPYATFSSNGGYSGDLNVAVLTDDFLTECLGQAKDKNGAILEATDDAGKEFALLFAVSSNKEPVRYALYSCTASRNDVEANTRADTTEPDTQSVTIACGSHTFALNGEEHDYVKARLKRSEENKAIFSKFYEAVYTPDMTAGA